MHCNVMLCFEVNYITFDTRACCRNNLIMCGAPMTHSEAKNPDHQNQKYRTNTPMDLITPNRQEL